jgi:hypothetical protein
VTKSEILARSSTRVLPVREVTIPIPNREESTESVELRKQFPEIDVDTCKNAFDPDTEQLLPIDEIPLTETSAPAKTFWKAENVDPKAVALAIDTVPTFSKVFELVTSESKWVRPPLTLSPDPMLTKQATESLEPRFVIEASDAPPCTTAKELIDAEVPIFTCNVILADEPTLANDRSDNELDIETSFNTDTVEVNTAWPLDNELPSLTKLAIDKDEPPWIAPVVLSIRSENRSLAVDSCLPLAMVPVTEKFDPIEELPFTVLSPWSEIFPVTAISLPNLLIDLTERPELIETLWVTESPPLMSDDPVVDSREVKTPAQAPDEDKFPPTSAAPIQEVFNEPKKSATAETVDPIWDLPVIEQVCPI